MAIFLNKLNCNFKVNTYSFYLILCTIAFLLSTPQNMMSPSLTDIANDLGFDERSRDLYIGSYMQLFYAVISLPFSLIGGILTDHINRISLLSIVVIFGGLSMIGFGLFQTYEILLFLRMIQGTAFGAVVPIIYSLMSDLFYPCKRARMSAEMTVYLGAGTLLGQLFAGYMAPILGWRLPFIFFGLITLFEGFCITSILKEPIRGGMDQDPNDIEEQRNLLHHNNHNILNDDPDSVTLLPTPTAHQSSLEISSSSNSSLSPSSSSSSSSPPPILSKDTLASMTHMFMIPSVLLMFIQAIPNNIPWGLLSVHMHDFLINEGQLDISTATSLIAIFGAGAALGGIGGGLLGTYFYSLSKWYLPFFMGITLIIAGLIMQLVFMLCIHPSKTIIFTSFIIGLAGGLASVNGALSRAILLNVSTPFTRGISVSCLTVINSLGRGVGPSIMTFLMHSLHVNRLLAMEYLLYLWVISGGMLIAICAFIKKDEENVRIHIRKTESNKQFPSNSLLSSSSSSSLSSSSSSKNHHNHGHFRYHGIK